MVLRNLLEAVGSIEVDRLQEHRINRTPSLSRSRALILDFRDLAISRDAVREREREREGGRGVCSPVLLFFAIGRVFRTHTCSNR